MSRKNINKNIILQITLIVSQNKVNGNIFITLFVYVKHMKKSKWLEYYMNLRRVFHKMKGEMTGQVRAQNHCDFRLRQIGKKTYSRSSTTSVNRY